MNSNSSEKLKKIFAGRNLLIATKHKKEKVIAPVLEKELGVVCIVSENFDTDTFGTFSGEIDRKDDPLATVRNKCLQAMELVNCDLAIASEGSFGAHQTLFFVPADDELVYLVDKKNNIEVWGRELSTRTNFSGIMIESETDLMEFADMVSFPSHGLIIKKAQEDNTEIVKGICNKQELLAHFDYFITKYGKAFIETDMRAMYNPTRMNIIEKATKNLIVKLINFCPNCDTPGFSITEVKAGLPCTRCKFPTRSTLAHIYECKKCSNKNEVLYPHKKYVEEPTFCDICNP
jgi:hypothetical protein